MISEKHLFFGQAPPLFLPQLVPLFCINCECLQVSEASEASVHHRTFLRHPTGPSASENMWIWGFHDSLICDPDPYSRHKSKMPADSVPNAEESSTQKSHLTFLLCAS